MRDDQIHAMIKKEFSHLENLSLLRSQQARLRLDSVLSALCEPKCIWRTFRNPSYLYGRVDEIFKIKAQAFNEDIKAAMTREKLNI